MKEHYLMGKTSISRGSLYLVVLVLLLTVWPTNNWLMAFVVLYCVAYATVVSLDHMERRQVRRETREEADHTHPFID